MPVTVTPLRYPGGKSQLAPLVVDILRRNDLLGGIYAEPFAGGAGLGLRLLLSGSVSELWLNDIDESIHAFWSAVLERTDDLCALVESVPVTIEEWHRQRRVICDGRTSTLRRALATLFLNRTNRSGILRGGVIGGQDQSGPYKLNCRFNKADLVLKIRRVAGYREVIRLERLEAMRCIRSWARRLPPRSLMNIDPPYFRRGQELYTNAYVAKDHAALAIIIRSLRCRWMLTYDDVPEVRRLYSGMRMRRNSLAYSAQVKRHAAELLVVSNSLALPPSSGVLG